MRAAEIRTGVLVRRGDWGAHQRTAYPESTWYLVTAPFSSNSTTRLCPAHHLSLREFWRNPTPERNHTSQEEALSFQTCIKSPKLLSYLGARSSRFPRVSRGIRFRDSRIAPVTGLTRVATFIGMQTCKKDAYENR